ncbi:MAG: type II toxin-antitoxin system VapC family toxin [Bacteroidota bacterium]
MLDTNICIYYMKGKFGLDKRFAEVENGDLYISEITLAELKFGVANSANPVKNQQVLSQFLSGVQVLPILDALDAYANEKTRLRKLGQPLDDFDLLIGASASSFNLVLVTNNLRHFERMNELTIEDWTTP